MCYPEGFVVFTYCVWNASECPARAFTCTWSVQVSAPWIVLGSMFNKCVLSGRSRSYMPLYSYVRQNSVCVCVCACVRARMRMRCGVYFWFHHHRQSSCKIVLWMTGYQTTKWIVFGNCDWGYADYHVVMAIQGRFQSGVLECWRCPSKAGDSPRRRPLHASSSKEVDLHDDGWSSVRFASLPPWPKPLSCRWHVHLPLQLTTGKASVYIGNMLALDFFLTTRL